MTFARSRGGLRLPLLLAASSLPCASCDSVASPLPLELVRIRKLPAVPGLDGDLEPSGLAWRGDVLVTVADDLSTHVIDLGGVGERKLSIALGAAIPGPAAKRDLEGIACVGDRYYVVDEAACAVLTWRNGDADVAAMRLVDQNPALRELLTGGGANSGLEGIAVGADAAGRMRMFVAKERRPRAIIELDPVTGTALRVLPEIVEAATPDVDRDYADLSMADGFLYVLERNYRAIHKVDPASGQVVDSRSFPRVAEALYDTGEPYGLCEGLCLSPTTIYLVVDNNGRKSWPPDSDRRPVLIELQRPPGF